MLIGVFIIILKHMVNILVTIPKIMILGIVAYCIKHISFNSPILLNRR